MAMRTFRWPGLRRATTTLGRRRAPFSTSTRWSARSPDSPFRMAVVGSGPAGFYTAYRVMGKLPGAHIDMYESLPVPFGLVRYGVAPDHPEVKNVQDKFEEIASSPNFTFVGNISIGRPGHSGAECVIELERLTQHYDAVLFAYGASEDKMLQIPGESTLRGIYSARQFVGWYNGLPDCAGLAPDLTKADEAVIIGQGNVALDAARMLLEDIDVLKRTDIAEHALATLAQSRVKRVHVVGRRGPMQAAFTIKEVRELMKLPHVQFLPVDRSLIPQDLKSLPRASKRLMEVMVKGSSTAAADTSKTWSLDSCLAPSSFLGGLESPENVAATEFNVMALASPHDPRSGVTPTGDKVTLPSDVVFRSVGYKSVPLPGFDRLGIQFDERRGVITNDGLGRVTRLVSDALVEHVENQQVPGTYCAGWVKTGPTGVIASTMQDAFITGDAVVSDWLSGRSFLNAASPGSAGGWHVLKKDVDTTGSRVVSWDDWRMIDKAERETGQQRGKGREKFTRTTDMLAVLN